MNYKVDVWFRVGLTNDQVKKEIKEMEAVLGAAVKAAGLGKRKLAYKIKTETEGQFYKLDFEAGPEKIADLTVFFSRSQNVLRYLLTRVKRQIRSTKSETNPNTKFRNSKV